MRLVNRHLRRLNWALCLRLVRVRLRRRLGCLILDNVIMLVLI